MTKRYIIDTEEECGTCIGLGWIENPEWKEPNAYYRTIPTDLPIGEREQIYDKYLIERFGTDDNSEWPAEELWCADCDGDGKIRSREDITDLIESLRSMALDDDSPSIAETIAANADAARYRS